MLDLHGSFEQGPNSRLWVPSRPAIVRRSETIKPIIPAGIMVVNGWLKQSAAAVAPTYVASGSQVENGTSKTLSVPYYAGLQVNDIGIIQIGGYAGGFGSGFTYPALTGWTAIGNVSHSDGGTRKADQGLYYKRLTGSESGTESITLTGGSSGAGEYVVVGRMFGIRGCITSGTPYEGLGSNSGLGGAASASIVTTGSSRLLLRLQMDEDGGGNSPPSGYTERHEETETFFGVMTPALDTKEMAASGTESATTRTIGGGISFVVQTLAMIPA